jgi:hypothetical protein
MINDQAEKAEKVATGRIFLRMRLRVDVSLVFEGCDR